MKRMVLAAVFISMLILTVLVDSVVAADDIEVEINEESVDVPVRKMNDSLHVPAEPFFEAFGARTRWFEDQRELSVAWGDFEMMLTVGESQVDVDGATQTWTDSVKKVDGVVYVPVEPAAEALGVLWEWCDETTTMKILTPEAFDPAQWDREGPGPPLYVAFPPGPEYDVYASPIFVFGTTQSFSQVDLWVNREPVDRFDPRTGNFLAMVDVPTDGEAHITVEAIGEGGRTVVRRSVRHPQFWEPIPSEPLMLHPTHVKPDEDQILKPGDELKILVRGSPEARAEFWIGDHEDPIEMNEREDQPGIYVGLYRVSEDDASESGLPDAHSIEVALNRDGERVSQKLPAQLRFFSETPYRVIQIKEHSELGSAGWWRAVEDEQTQIYGSTRGGTAHPATTMGYLVAGTRYNAVGVSGDYYRVELGEEGTHLINKEAAEEIEDRRTLEATPVSLHLSETEERIRFRFKAGERFPFYVEDGTDNLVLRMYGTRGDVSVSDTVRGVQNLSVESPEGDLGDTVKMTVDFTEEITGYECSWEQAHLVLDVFKPPQVSQQHPLLGRKIVIDPGHGGYDRGAIGPTGVDEKDVVLDISLQLKELLELEGAEVVMTRTEDGYVGLYERPADITEYDADFFISVHTNAHAHGAQAPDIHGFMTLYDYAHNEKVADIMLQRLTEDVQMPEFRTWRRRLAVLRHTGVPSVLVEAGYMMHPGDNWHILNPSGQRNLARAMKRGIADYFLSFTSATAPEAFNLEPSEYFADAAEWKEEPFADAACFLGYAGVFEGDETGNLLPYRTLTREQMAVILARITGQAEAAQALQEDRTGFKDDEQISSWAQGYMVLAEEESWFKGYPDGTVRPQANLNLAQIAALLLRVTENEHLATGSWPTSVMTAADYLGLFEDIDADFSDRDVLRGEMISATLAAMIVPGRKDREDEDGKSMQTMPLLERHYEDTWQLFLDATR